MTDQHGPGGGEPHVVVEDLIHHTELPRTALSNALSKSEHNQGAVMAGFPAKGVTARKLPEPILRELDKVTQEVLAEEAANDAMFAKIWESQKAFREQYKLWKTFGYLPRDF